MAEIYLPGWVGLTLIIWLSLSSNWTELDWTGTELGNISEIDEQTIIIRQTDQTR